MNDVRCYLNVPVTSDYLGTFLRTHQKTHQENISVEDVEHNMDCVRAFVYYYLLTVYFFRSALYEVFIIYPIKKDCLEIFYVLNKRMDIYSV